MTHDVFISHSSADAQVALAIVNALESRGIRCWIAPRDIQGGQIWAEAIMQGIDSVRALVVVFSSSANRSTHVLTEVDTAVRRGCIVVPFRIEAVEPEGALAYHLRTRHWLDALTPALATHINLLADTLSRLLAQSPAAPLTGSQPWLSAVPPLREPAAPPAAPASPAPPAAPPLRRRWPMLLAIATVVLVTLGALLLWIDQQRGAFVIRDASVPSDPVSVPVQVTGVRFFEASGDMPPTDQREHATRFAAGTSRYIYVQIDLSHGAPPREVRVPISCTITNQDGAVVTTITATGRLQPDWEGSNWASGWGGDAAGTWEAGRYAAACTYGGEEIASGKFEVVGGGEAPAPAPESGVAARVDPRIPELNGEISGLRFFPDYEGPITPKPERKYTTSFAARDLLYLGIELEVDYPAPGRQVKLEVTCVITRPGGGTFGQVTLTIEPEPEWTGSFSAASYGWAEAGRWPPGTYQVDCRLGGRLVAQGAVTIR